MENYSVLSLETNLFFARIMKEHGLFLAAGFPCGESEWIQRADWFRRQFEELLRDTVELADGRVNRRILHSGELVTEYTIFAEQRTEQLGGVPIDSRISEAQQNLRSGGCEWEDLDVVRAVTRINLRAVELLEDFIEFKQNILDEVSKGQLFNTNYPLLVEHIQREAKLYHATLTELLEDQELSYEGLKETEMFWNRIMMEHALFIRGLLDPTEEELIETADRFACEYRELLEKAKSQDCKAMGLTEETLAQTCKYRDFKAAGTAGILDCKISSIILPLLADHVLREANHFIRLLETMQAD